MAHSDNCICSHVNNFKCHDDYIFIVEKGTVKVSPGVKPDKYTMN